MPSKCNYTFNLHGAWEVEENVNRFFSLLAIRVSFSLSFFFSFFKDSKYSAVSLDLPLKPVEFKMLVDSCLLTFVLQFGGFVQLSWFIIESPPPDPMSGT